MADTERTRSLDKDEAWELSEHVRDLLKLREVLLSQLVHIDIGIKQTTAEILDTYNVMSAVLERKMDIPAVLEEPVVLETVSLTYTLQTTAPGYMSTCCPLQPAGGCNQNPPSQVVVQELLTGLIEQVCEESIPETNGENPSSAGRDNLPAQEEDSNSSPCGTASSQRCKTKVKPGKEEELFLGQATPVLAPSGHDSDSPQATKIHSCEDATLDRNKTLLPHLDVGVDSDDPLGIAKLSEYFTDKVCMKETTTSKEPSANTGGGERTKKGMKADKKDNKANKENESSEEEKVFPLAEKCGDLEAPCLKALNQLQALEGALISQENILKSMIQQQQQESVNQEEAASSEVGQGCGEDSNKVSGTALASQLGKIQRNIQQAQQQLHTLQQQLDSLTHRKRLLEDSHPDKQLVDAELLRTEKRLEQLLSRLELAAKRNNRVSELLA